MQAVSHQATPADELDRWMLRATTRAPGLHTVLPAGADPFFRLDLAVVHKDVTALIPAGFAAVVVLDGAGELATGDGAEPVARGDVLAVPAASGDWTVRGDAEVLVARPGSPTVVT
jgi:mannose-6-phosphate isomerase